MEEGIHVFGLQVVQMETFKLREYFFFFEEESSYVALAGLELHVVQTGLKLTDICLPLAPVC